MICLIFSIEGYWKCLNTESDNQREVDMWYYINYLIVKQNIYFMFMRVIIFKNVWIEKSYKDCDLLTSVIMAHQNLKNIIVIIMVVEIGLLWIINLNFVMFWCVYRSLMYKLRNLLLNTNSCGYLFFSITF